MKRNYPALVTLSLALGVPAVFADPSPSPSPTPSSSASPEPSESSSPDPSPSPSPSPSNEFETCCGVAFRIQSCHKDENGQTVLTYTPPIGTKPLKSAYVPDNSGWNVPLSRTGISILKNITHACDSTLTNTNTWGQDALYLISYDCEQDEPVPFKIFETEVDLGIVYGTWQERRDSCEQRWNDW